MSKLPIVSGRQLVEFMRGYGWAVARQRGSHVSMVKDGYRTVVIPDKDELGPHVVLANLKTAKISKREFERYFQKGKRNKKKPATS
ncbi:MAG: type II toxin-antitoxin system HicA family toxin [Gammaproteobacteria bacterium]